MSEALREKNQDRGRQKKQLRPIGIFRLVRLLVFGLLFESYMPRVTLEAEELRDPFMFGPRESQRATTQPIVTGIAWDAKRPLALIDGEPVTVGQIVEGWQIVEIQPDSITVEQDLRREILHSGDRFPSE